MEVGAENVERLGKNVIVDETGVDGEATHHGNYVATSKKDLEDLRTLSLRLQHSLLQILINCQAPLTKSHFLNILAESPRVIMLTSLKS